MTDGIFNAKIDRFYLGLEDHEIPCYGIDFDFGDSVQSTGYYDLRDDKSFKKCWTVMKFLDIRDPQKAAGKPVRVKREDGMITEIGHYLHDKWVRVRNN